MWNAVQIRPILPYIIGGSRPTPRDFTHKQRKGVRLLPVMFSV